MRRLAFVRLAPEKSTKMQVARISTCFSKIGSLEIYSLEIGSLEIDSLEIGFAENEFPGDRL